MVVVILSRLSKGEHSTIRPIKITAKKTRANKEVAGSDVSERLAWGLGVSEVMFVFVSLSSLSLGWAGLSTCFV